MRTIFEYLYRDAGNFKAFGSIAFRGRLTPHAETLIRSKLESGEYFVAEQVGIPTLYDQLYRWSDGPIAADHCWHEFVDCRNAGRAEQGIACAGTVAELVGRFISVDQWDGARSPHFDISDSDWREHRSNCPRDLGSISS